MNATDGTIRHGVATDIGLARDTNEDAYLALPPLFAIADGMGGHTAGDVAAKTAVQVLARKMNEAQDLEAAVRSANSEVFQMASANPSQRGMGTTLTAMVADGNSALFVHVGDSRAYLLRNGELSRITQDHTVVERLVKEGRLRPEDADRHPQRSILERALGVGPEIETDQYTLNMQPADRVLLCSDGLTGPLSDFEIQSILEEEVDPDVACRRLVNEAIRSGGADNITALVVDYPGERIATARPTEPTDSKDDQKAILGARRRSFPPISRRIVILLAALMILLGFGFMARAAALKSYYVGVDRGRVAIYRGIPGSFAGVEVNDLERTTGLEVSKLPDVYQMRLEEGIRASSKTDAAAIVANLEDLQSEEASHQRPPEAGP